MRSRAKLAGTASKHFEVSEGSIVSARDLVLVHKVVMNELQPLVQISISNFVRVLGVASIQWFESTIRGTPCSKLYVAISWSPMYLSLDSQKMRWWHVSYAVPSPRHAP